MKSGVKINGTTITGFNTIGKPKIIGSLIPKIPGINDNLPSSVIRFERQKKSIAMIRESVEPAPPKTANKSWNCPLMICGVPTPDLKNSIFSSERVARTGLYTAPTIAPPLIPKNQNKQLKK